MKNNSALYFLSFSIFALALSLLISSGDTAQLKANDEFKQYYRIYALSMPKSLSFADQKVPLTDYDVVNKAYLTSFTSKYYKNLTTLDYFIYVDLTKPHVFSLSYITGGTTVRDPNYSAILYTFPLIDKDLYTSNMLLPYKIITGTSGITQNYITNNSSTNVVFNLINLKMIAGILSLNPNTTNSYPQNIQLYEL
jgi:hypothetical protein